ncbi:hypothetical protein EYC80_004887 [Monilinia laxa]|uniref:Uncharacterized protein n=1 Tax=Monilinia laxa TaxID=61186 RepID=A0A5N6KIH4_MONLA|nr:hypothetical protein EYC80_004887 [Monilinia laxa]
MWCMLYPFHSQLVNFSTRQRVKAGKRKLSPNSQIVSFSLSFSSTHSILPPSSVKGFIHLSEKTGTSLSPHLPDKINVCVASILHFHWVHCSLNKLASGHISTRCPSSVIGMDPWKKVVFANVIFISNEQSRSVYLYVRNPNPKIEIGS